MGGTLPPRFTDISPKIFLLKGEYIVFLPKKHLTLIQKIGYGFGGYPPLFMDIFLLKNGKKKLRIWGVPPFMDKKKELWIWGIPHPPFTDKIRKVVFEGAPQFYFIFSYHINCSFYAVLDLGKLYLTNTIDAITRTADAKRI